MSTRQLLIGATALATIGCVRPQSQFDRDLDARQWSAAAAAFDADTSLLSNDGALLRAATLYGSPNRPNYNLDRADSLLRRLIRQFPQSSHRADATDRLEVVDALIARRDSVVVRMRGLDARIVELTNTTRRMRASLDSASMQTDSLRRSATRLEADLRDRDEQLRALRLELQQLKEIDLKKPAPKKPPM